MKYTKKEIELIENNQSLSYEEIASKLKEELGIKRSAESIRKKYKLLGLKAKKQTTQNTAKFIEEEDKPKFHVDKKDNVAWDYKHGVIEINLDTLDQIFYEYSRHGLNLSQTKIQNKHGLTAIQWQSLKRTFDLVKDSDVFTHIQLQRHEPEVQCKMIADRIAQKYSSKSMRAIVEYEDNKQRHRAYEKAIKTSEKQDYRRQIFETEILDYITKANPVNVRVVETPGLIDESVCHVCDLHVGANIIGQNNLPEFNAQIIIDSLTETARLSNLKGAKKVTVVINGDVIETFTGLNHINSWKNIDMKYGYGVKATIKAVEILTDFISKVNNVHEVLLVAGNHDRVTSNNKEDVEGEVIQWVHHMLHAKFGHLFSVEWSPDVIVREIGGVGFIFTHGHLALSKKSPAEIVNQYGIIGIYNVIIEGHLHSRMIKNDGTNYRHIVAPSIFTGNNYSKNLGFTTLAGFLFIYTINGYPVVEDYPIKIAP